MNNKNRNNEKPSWLLKLEQESWQAELIVSGVAILGTLQLPNLVDRLGQWALIYFSEDLGLVLLFLLNFLYFICAILIFGFIVEWRKGALE